MNLLSYLKFIIFLGVSITIFGCQQQSSLSELKKQNESVDIESPGNIAVEQNKSDIEKITYLNKVGVIEDGFCEEEYNFFAKITSLCVDVDNNLYVADSKLHRINKFDNKGKYICSFGSQGQGPGEFLGTLKAIIGNDGKLYVTDDGNWRLSIFSPQGKFIQQFHIQRYLYDIAIANSKSEIYMLSQSGLKIIDFFDSNMKFKESFLDINYQLNFPYHNPPKILLKRMRIIPSAFEVKKLLTKDDHFFTIINNTQLVIHLDKNHKLVKQFTIQHLRFVKDYKNRLKEALSKGAWINPFGSIFFDHKENLCLCYYNASLELPEIYRYKKDGAFIDTLRAKNIKTKTNQLVSTCSNKGDFYSISHSSTKITIFRLSH